MTESTPIPRESAPPASPRARHRLLFASLAGLVLALGGVIWLGFQEPSAPKQVMPDGTVLELLGVTYGKPEMVYGSFWERTTGLARSWIRKRLPFQDRRFEYLNDEALMNVMSYGAFFRDGKAYWSSFSGVPLAWFRVRIPIGTSVDGEFPSQVNSAVARDDDGCLYHCTEGGPVHRCDAIPKHPRESLAICELQNYPRRKADFTFELHGGGQDDPVLARFRLPNSSIPLPTTVWNAMRPPVTATQDGICCRLAKLERRPPSFGSQQEAASLPAQRDRPAAPRPLPTDRGWPQRQ